MFCQGCGAPLTGAFCTKCGARAVQPPQPVQPGGPPPSPPPPPQQYAAPAPPPPQYAPPPQAYSQPLAPAASSGSGLKILFIVLGVFAFLGMLGIGAVWYGWHVMKDKAAQKGIDLNAFSEHHGPGRRVDACQLLTKDDLSQILNLAVERSEGTGRSTHSTCRYYSAEAQQRGVDEAAAAFKKIQESSKAGDADAKKEEEAMKNLGTLVRGMAGAANASENGAMLSIEVESDNAKAAMATYKLALNIGAAGAPADTQARKLLIEDVNGVADEAVFGPLMSMFVFRKGDVVVSIDARGLPGGRDAELSIAKRIVSRL